MSANYLPPEWEPQSGIMLAWPHANSDWQSTLPQIEPLYCQMVKQITRFEKVLIICYDDIQQQQIRIRLSDADVDELQVQFSINPFNDTWVRDYGPITLYHHGEPLLTDFTFNGWGGKYAAKLDNQITQQIHAQGHFGLTPLNHSTFVLEGGSIDVNGHGVLLTTTACLLSAKRNPELSREQIEQQLKQQLSVTQVVWLEHGYLAGDDSDSHVDMLARFCNDSTIAYTSCNDPDDEHFIELAKMRDELCALRQHHDLPYELIPLPLPAPKYDDNGRRLPASYTNFLIINGAVLLPVYDDPADEIAIKHLNRCFPQHELIPILALPLITQNGSIHCATMQLPAGLLSC